MIMSNKRTSAQVLAREQQRAALRQWGQGSWADRCEAISFHRQRFDLQEFTGRGEFGTKPLWYRVLWVAQLVVLFPVWFLYGWIRQGLDDAGVTKPPAKKGITPGVVSVVGSTQNPASTAVIDTVKRASRDLWIVFSNSRLAVLVMNDKDSPPQVIWQTDESADVRFHHAAVNSIEITWRDRNRVLFCPTIDEREVVTRFVKSTWNDQR
ncbi:hypothetical protein GIY23_20580 [Allosaccharopolyspora coralli]|uniref:Uncharacterized protein n=1 Tax=Allosaccharopolyspora coralli TaxID=2665642 RepID=A0A5Q3QDZ7_9PSEU|nr:hypothetical protein [Allosaccharopolyspora coralli]QGK71596.1 hypothetical protein GIY23_20580 [Allosaccharopolyspora coralli]